MCPYLPTPRLGQDDSILTVLEEFENRLEKVNNKDGGHMILKIYKEINKSSKVELSCVYFFIKLFPRLHNIGYLILKLLQNYMKNSPPKLIPLGSIISK